MNAINFIQQHGVAIARCTAVVEQRNPAAALLGKMISWGATA